MIVELVGESGGSLRRFFHEFRKHLVSCGSIGREGNCPADPVRIDVIAVPFQGLDSAASPVGGQILGILDRQKRPAPVRQRFGTDQLSFSMESRTEFTIRGPINLRPNDAVVRATETQITSSFSKSQSSE
jgi:hypothetical protein